ncbi:MAG: antitoxin VbhA family protein [Bacillota bacterium]|nr:antitoxin VbhA family protein [Bacillota bacterium]
MKTQTRNINKIMSSVSATLAVEGMKPSESGAAITRQYLEGKITSKQAIQRIKDKHLKILVK